MSDAIICAHLINGVTNSILCNMRCIKYGTKKNIAQQAATSKTLNLKYKPKKISSIELGIYGKKQIHAAKNGENINKFSAYKNDLGYILNGLMFIIGLQEDWQFMQQDIGFFQLYKNKILNNSMLLKSN